MIEQRALFKLGILNFRMDRKQTPSHLQHVVDIAAFVGAPFDPIAKLVRWPKVFISAVTAGCVAVMQSNRIPEELSRRPVFLITRVDVAREIADQLWDLRVSVQAGKDVLALRQRIEHGVMIKVMRKIQPALVSSVGVKISQYLIHAAEFRV